VVQLPRAPYCEDTKIPPPIVETDMYWPDIAHV
jgi:hypothetical protein